MFNTRRLLGALILLAVILSFGPAAIAQGVPEGPVRIGFMGPLTGGAAFLGEEQVNFARLAVDDFNAATGWNVELVEGDTMIDPAEAVIVAEALLADSDLYAVVGPAGSQVVEATQQMFKDARVAHVSGSATRTTLTLTDFDTFFRTVPTDAAQGPTAANYLANVIGASSLFLIDDQTSYSVGLGDEVEPAFVAAGGTIAGRESITQDDVDFSALVTVIGGSGADAVFIASQIPSQGALLGQQLQEQGVNATLFGADGFFAPDDFIAAAEGATEGAYVSFFSPDIHNLPVAADVVARFSAQYGDFGSFGAPSYVAAQVVLEAMQRAFEANGELTREAVRAEVANTSIGQTIMGIPLAFDMNGDVQGAEFYIYQVQMGHFELVAPGE
jgi:branched-chain amino acid transport system substrate-binding protein